MLAIVGVTHCAPAHEPECREKQGEDDGTAEPVGEPRVYEPDHKRDRDGKHRAYGAPRASMGRAGSACRSPVRQAVGRSRAQTRQKRRAPMERRRSPSVSLESACHARDDSGARTPSPPDQGLCRKRIRCGDPDIQRPVRLSVAVAGSAFGLGQSSRSAFGLRDRPARLPRRAGPPPDRRRSDRFGGGRADDLHSERLSGRCERGIVGAERRSRSWQRGNAKVGEDLFEAAWSGDAQDPRLLRRD